MNTIIFVGRGEIIEREVKPPEDYALIGFLFNVLIEGFFIEFPFFRFNFIALKKVFIFRDIFGGIAGIEKYRNDKKQYIWNPWAQFSLLKIKSTNFNAANIFFTFAVTQNETMISANQSKLIRSLRQKKNRDQSGLYLMEGEKMIGELLEGIGGEHHNIQQLFATAEWTDRNTELINQLQGKVNEVSISELQKVSNLVTSQHVLALVTQPKRDPSLEIMIRKPTLAFESIRDPGNLGTIIRTADWFGIDHVICTPDSVDVFNPKVVQATMGAITRVEIYYADIESFLSETVMNDKVVYGTFLDGDNIYEQDLDENPLILFGNESHGLSDRYDKFITQRIAIPSNSNCGKGSESLNVASSVAVFCSELIRKG